MITVANPRIIIDSSGSMPSRPYPMTKMSAFSCDESIVASLDCVRCVIKTDAYNVHVLNGDDKFFVRVAGKENSHNGNGVSIEKNEANGEFSVSVNRNMVGASKGIEIFVYIPTIFAGDLIVESKYGNISVVGINSKLKGVNISSCSGDILWDGDISAGGMHVSSKHGNVSILGRLLSDVDFSSNSTSGNININICNCKKIDDSVKMYIPMDGRIKIGPTDDGEYVFSVSILTTCGTISIND